MKTFPIHLPNGSTVCTPDRHAMKIRVRRCKRVLRANIRLHNEYLKMCLQANQKRCKLINSLVDICSGVSVSMLLFAVMSYSI